MELRNRRTREIMTLMMVFSFDYKYCEAQNNSQLRRMLEVRSAASRAAQMAEFRQLTQSPPGTRTHIV